MGSCEGYVDYQAQNGILEHPNSVPMSRSNPDEDMPMAMPIPPPPPAIPGDWYLQSYCQTRIHRIMLGDKVRMETYRKAIELNRHLIKDKVIMDVGCGTGILSLFAARAGAGRVIAVECSDMADNAKQIMIDNKFDHIVTVIKGRLEDITELPFGIEKVDVIISEFMGYTLFYENMLDTVVYARDRWLKPGGPILPDQCSLYIFGISDAENKIRRIDFWNAVNVRGDVYDLGVMRTTALRRVWKRRVRNSNIVTNAKKLVDVDMNTITLEDLQLMRCDFQLKARYKTKNVICHGVGTYFTVTFSRCHQPLVLSTAPWDKPTHWEQMIFFFTRDVEMEPKSTLEGYWAFRKHPNFPRDVQFAVHVSYTGYNERFEEHNIHLSV